MAPDDGAITRSRRDDNQASNFGAQSKAARVKASRSVRRYQRAAGHGAVAQHLTEQSGESGSLPIPPTPGWQKIKLVVRVLSHHSHQSTTTNKTAVMKLLSLFSWAMMLSALVIAMAVPVLALPSGAVAVLQRHEGEGALDIRTGYNLCQCCMTNGASVALETWCLAERIHGRNHLLPQSHTRLLRSLPWI